MWVMLGLKYRLSLIHCISRYVDAFAIQFFTKWRAARWLENGTLI